MLHEGGMGGQEQFVRWSAAKPDSLAPGQQFMGRPETREQSARDKALAIYGDMLQDPQKRWKLAKDRQHLRDIGVDEYVMSKRGSLTELERVVMEKKNEPLFSAYEGCVLPVEELPDDYFVEEHPEKGWVVTDPVPDNKGFIQVGKIKQVKNQSTWSYLPVPEVSLAEMNSSR